jgi:hypothetical protein
LPTTRASALPSPNPLEAWVLRGHLPPHGDGCLPFFASVSVLEERLSSQVERFRPAKIKNALAHLVAGKARYRMILDVKA